MIYGCSINSDFIPPSGRNEPKETYFLNKQKLIEWMPPLLPIELRPTVGTHNPINVFLLFAS